MRQNVPEPFERLSSSKEQPSGIPIWNFELWLSLSRALAVGPRSLHVIWKNNTLRLNSLITHSDSFSTLCPIN